MRTIISSSGRILLPAKIRKQDRIQPGQPLEIERLAHGRYLLRKPRHGNNEGLVDWLLSCPVKGWFEPRREDRWPSALT